MRQKTSRSNAEWRTLWIVDKRTARRAAAPAVVAAGFLAALTLVHVLTSLALPPGVHGRSPIALIDVALFGLAALGIYHLSRFAAVAAYALYLGAVAMSGTAKLWAFMLFTALFVIGILATVIYRDLEKHRHAEDGRIA